MRQASSSVAQPATREEYCRALIQEGVLDENDLCLGSYDSFDGLKLSGFKKLYQHITANEF